MLSCSTCWNSQRHTDGEAMLDEILEMGFERIELGHGIRLSLMEGILRAAEKGKVKFSSLHNFCPLPVEITRPSPDCYQFSSPDQRERERAIRFSFQTIDFAARLGAPIVVLHLGRVPIEDYTEKLVRMAEVGMHLSRGYVQTKLEAVRKREAAAPPFFQRSLDCLTPIADQAARKGITLGVESRHSFEEIPGEEEMVDVLDAFAVSHVGYWHDFGHVQVKHNLGFLDHVEWMDRVGHRLVGCHLHDTQWPGRDHQPPFTGDVPYDKLIPLLPKREKTLFVFEMSPRRTREEIMTARQQWAERYGA
ncbi:MAG TPA: sugar phosphate isomerase/epimerase family protein [Chthoniobacteraceae bacterium]